MTTEAKALVKDLVMLARMMQMAADNNDGKTVMRYTDSVGKLLNRINEDVLSNAEKNGN